MKFSDKQNTGAHRGGDSDRPRVLQFGSGRNAVMVRPEESDNCFARWLWRQQLAPGDDCFRQGGSPQVPQYHEV